MRRREFLRTSFEGTVATALASTGLPSRVRGESVTNRQPATGPLRVHPKNPRYFTDDGQRAVLLTGSHMWNNLVDMGPSDPPYKLDFDAYLDFLVRYDHNFIRLWAWELLAWDSRANGRWGKEKIHTVAPLPFARVGRGKAVDGKPKFDLHKYDPEYFSRLRQRVVAAGKRGIYVSVMLFEGWAMQHMTNGWSQHPFHPRNNVNGIDGDKDGDGRGLEVHRLANPDVLAIQEAYVRKVVDTVNDLDNVLYEITNENHPESTEWQYHVINFVHKYEKTKPRQHPVGMTFQYKGGSNRTLFDSPAEWISPNNEGGYRDNPPAADGKKVILSDTDHLWGIGGNQAWVWKSFLRGLNPLFMDPYDGVVLATPFDPKWDPIRRSVGYVQSYARRLDLAACQPHTKLASTRYCLADPGKQYLVYLPDGGKVTVDLSAAKGRLTAEWFNPTTGKKAGTKRVAGGASRELAAPFKGDAVLCITL